MAPPTNKAKLSQLSSQLHESMVWRETERKEMLWKSLVDLYKGKHYNAAAESDRAVVNLAFATKNVIAPSVAVSNPKFSVNARKPEGAAQAVVTQEVLNYVWRTYHYQQEFRLAVDDMLTVGHGWIKVGYKSTKPPEVKLADDNDPEHAESYGIDDRDASAVGNVESELYMAWDDDRPFAERISFFDIFVDPHARHPKEMKWIAQRTRRLVNDVKVDSRYDKAARKEASATSRTSYQSSHQDGRDDQSTVGTQGDYCDVIEFYDLRRQEVSTFLSNTPGEGEFLIKPEKMPYSFGHPFVMLRDYEVIDHFYPMGELEAIKVLQQELNITRTQMLNHRSKFARKYMYHADTWDQLGVNGLKSDVDNEMVPYPGDIQDMERSVVAMPVQGTPAEFYNQSDMIISDIDRVSGTSEYQRGGGQNIRRTATEASMIQDASNARSSDKLSSIERSLAEIGSRLIQLMQQFMTGEHVIRIVGQSHPTWVKFDSDYIQGEFDYDVEAGSTAPNNESMKQQKAFEMNEIFGQYLGAFIDPMAFIPELLRLMGVKDPKSMMLQPQGGPSGPAGPAGPPGGGMHMMPDGTEMPDDAMAPGGELPPGGAIPPGMPPGAPQGAGGMPPGIPPEMLAQMQEMGL
jgi:hypothetical protein